MMSLFHVCSGLLYMFTFRFSVTYCKLKVGSSTVAMLLYSNDDVRSLFVILCRSVSSKFTVLLLP